MSSCNAVLITGCKEDTSVGSHCPQSRVYCVTKSATHLTPTRFNTLQHILTHCDTFNTLCQVSTEDDPAAGLHPVPAPDAGEPDQGGQPGPGAERSVGRRDMSLKDRIKSETIL